MGRLFLTIAHNKTRNATTNIWNDDFIATREYTDIEGNRTKIIDALGRESLLYFYDLLQRPLRTESIDGGKRWMLTAVDGQPVNRWDERGSLFEHKYDALRRPTEMLLLSGIPAEPYPDPNIPIVANPASPILIKTEYGDYPQISNRAAVQARNQIGMPVLVMDTAGKLYFESYNYQGKPLSQIRQLSFPKITGLHKQG